MQPGQGDTDGGMGAQMQDEKLAVERSYQYPIVSALPRAVLRPQLGMTRTEQLTFSARERLVSKRGD
jgi:hypothetical protein